MVSQKRDYYINSIMRYEAPNLQHFASCQFTSGLQVESHVMSLEVEVTCSRKRPNHCIAAAGCSNSSSVTVYHKKGGLNKLKKLRTSGQGHQSTPYYAVITSQNSRVVGNDKEAIKKGSSSFHLQKDLE